MILYLVRHGETENNKNGIVQGQMEADLSPKGIEDAKKIKKLVSELDIDVVISSPLKRAIDTAKIITDNKYPINIDDRIIERSWGFSEGVKMEEVGEKKTIERWNFYTNTSDGDDHIEKVQDFLKRLSEFIEDIRIKYSDSKVLVVAHSAVLRGIHYIINGIPEDGDLSKIEIPNLRIIEYEL
ncbi:MAG: histidine phosphatase family protein [Bacilli bacterium]|nr:histidine phosphatase family protein [Bacilli bacterium]